MLRRFCLFALLFLTSGLLAVAKDPKKDLRYFSPIFFEREVELLVSGKLRPYYQLDSGGKIEISVKGPTKLHLLSRVVLPSGVDSVEYMYLVRRKEGKKAVSMTHRAAASDKASLASDRGTRVTASRTKVIDVPRGTQTYTITLPKGAARSLLFRFATETNAFKKNTRVVSMTPVEYAAAVGLVSGEENTTYYRVSGSQSAALQLIGPATMKVMSRIEFDSSMTGKQKWKVQVLEDGKVKATYSLAARKSEIATYRDPSLYVPSRAETFFVEIPAGEHVYEFRLPENHRTVLMRYLLPEAQLNRE